MHPKLPADLSAILLSATAHLREGASDPGSPWRQMALGTVGLAGEPSVRTVVLRGFDDAAGWLEVHTDIRSAKHAELAARPAATLHGWDKAEAVQLRASGKARLHTGDAVAHAAWAALRRASRVTYQTRLGPGTRLAEPGAGSPRLSDAEAQAVFCVIRLELRALDWLHLAQGSHRRARFAWEAGAVTATWLVP